MDSPEHEHTSVKKYFSIALCLFFGGFMLSCEPQVSSTCDECQFFEFEYKENLSIISGFDTTKILVEQPYPDWEFQDSLGSPEIVFSNFQASDSTIVLRLTVEAGAGSEDARAERQVGYDGEQFRVWYGSASRQYFQGKSVAVPRPPYFRIKEIEVITPYQKEAEITFNIRY